jgi:hypothetical protein
MMGIIKMIFQALIGVSLALLVVGFVFVVALFLLAIFIIVMVALITAIAA